MDSLINTQESQARMESRQSRGIDSILFEDDKGPASSFLKEQDQTEEDPIMKRVRIIPTNGPFNSQSSRGQSTRVRFSGLEDSNDEEKKTLSLDEMLLELRDQYAQAKVDISAEKALRKRKEKNLVKLAKELNKRSADLQTKEAKIMEMASSINELEEQLENTKRESTKDLLAYRSTCRENETRISTLDSLVEKLRKELFETNLEVDHLRSQLAAAEMRESPEKAGYIKQRALELSNSPIKIISFQESFEATNAAPQSRPFTGLLLSLFVSIAAAVAVQREITSVDSLCAPILPGTEIQSSGNSVSGEAPWWAPASVKEQAFSAVCAGRDRTRISWGAEKLSIYSLSSRDNNNNPVLVWQGKAPQGVKIGAKNIIVKNKKGMAEVTAPWSS